MASSKLTPRIVGILFIIGTVSGVLSGVLTMSIFDDDAYLTKIAENEDQVALGALFVLSMGFSLAMVPAVLYPIFKKQNEVLALGALIFRGVLEAVTYMLMVVVWLVLITLSREYTQAAAPDAAYFETLGTLLKESSDWIGHVLSIVFSIGALMIYYLFYQMKLIPRWLSGWGFVGGILYIMVPFAALFGSNVEILYAPLAIQEMVMALWLIVRGFNQPAAAESA